MDETQVTTEVTKQSNCSKQLNNHPVFPDVQVEEER
jgi:hypothetical protein